MFYRILVPVCFLFLTACSNLSTTQTAATHSDGDDPIGELILKTNATERKIINKKLNNFYQEWVGVRYKLGGTGKNGIDCSAFVQTAFAEKFHISLPRSTSEQKSLGRQIQKNQLKQGDLVFFRKNHHVGIYLGDDLFIHSSTSQGVTISSLSEDYWTRTYTQSRRILD
ncbi:endopeptidase [Gallibacterium salpingitidis]|uniref:Endopeptidase n=1 Tax=Gallibacterium salpingitidis TaxID=505341 RepID=A0AB36E000_9PAST|nr:NlpC/P60 family protein [Gallibacterium salpingitidis]OBX07286.1 endopeptidase [Gallibacterium salpingitidis]OBX08308.1 endopeptidase [Gallibacterium salpingitidis]WKS98547.1 NlpC/P60 family protein [Gallibacterium salpingitidis]